MSFRASKIVRKVLTSLSAKNNVYIFNSLATNLYSIPLYKKESHITYNKRKDFSALQLKSYSTISASSRTFKLDPYECDRWTKEEVCSLLSTDSDLGGAGMLPEKVTELYHSTGFDGSSILLIIADLQQEKDAVAEVCKSHPNIPRDTIKTIVNWVIRLLHTRFYQFWDNSHVIAQMRYNVNLSSLYIQQFDSEYYNGKWIRQVILNSANKVVDEEYWPENLKSEVRFRIEKWLKSLLFEATPFLDGDSFIDRLTSAALAFDMLSIKPDWGPNGPPFVDRHQSILQTITCLDGISSIKPIFPIISTSMGMGKTTFLLSFARKFLTDPKLMYEYIFDNPHPDEISLETLKEMVELKKNCPKVEFVNKLYRAINSGHFIAFEPITAQVNDQPEYLLETGIISYLEKMFIGASVKLHETSQPTTILSLQQALLPNINKTITAKLKRFSDLIKWNAPRYYENLLPQQGNVNDELPLLIFIDSFHLMNFDKSNKGTLYNTCTLVSKWKREIPMLSLIISTNALPNQFLSQEKTLFFLNSINLELLIGNEIFNEIIFDLYGAYLNSSVLKECFGGNVNADSTPKEKQLSPFLTRVIISMLYMCSGNGRAIERVYKNCNGIIQPAIEHELSMSYKDRMSLEHADVYHQIWQKCRETVKNYVMLYPELHSHSIFANKKLYKLVRIMGLNAAPDYIFPGTNLSIEELQKLGLFVKFRVDDTELTCRYGGSFMMLDIHGKVDELKPISTFNSKYYSHIEIELQWLLQPYSNINILSNKKQGDYFEQTIASSIWARYNIACMENNLAIGDSIDISKVLPACMIPTAFENGRISLKGVVKLNKQFIDTSSKGILPRDRVIINADQSPFSDLILPVKVGSTTKFIGFQTNYLREGSAKKSPYVFIDNAMNVLSVKNFAYVHVCTFVTELLQSFPNTTVASLTQLAEHKDLVKFASCENLVSVWWFEIMYKQNPHM